MPSTGSHTVNAAVATLQHSHRPLARRPCPRIRRRPCAAAGGWPPVPGLSVCTRAARRSDAFVVKLSRGAARSRTRGKLNGRSSGLDQRRGAATRCWPIAVLSRALLASGIDGSAASSAPFRRTLGRGGRGLADGLDVEQHGWVHLTGCWNCSAGKFPKLLPFIAVTDGRGRAGWLCTAELDVHF